MLSIININIKAKKRVSCAGETARAKALGLEYAWSTREGEGADCEGAQDHRHDLLLHFTLSGMRAVFISTVSTLCYSNSFNLQASLEGIPISQERRLRHSQVLGMSREETPREGVPCCLHSSWGKDRI